MCIPGQKNLSLNNSSTLSWPRWPTWSWQPAMAFDLYDWGRTSWSLALSCTWVFLYNTPCFNFNCFLILRKALRSELISCLCLIVFKCLVWIAWMIWLIAGSCIWCLTPLKWSHASSHSVLWQYPYCLGPMAKSFYFAMRGLYPFTDCLYRLGGNINCLRPLYPRQSISICIIPTRFVGYAKGVVG